MLHKFFEAGDWFAPRRFGYGAGRPVAWQGWVLLLAYATLMLGVGCLLPAAGFTGKAIGIAVMTLATIAFILIARRRTKGGWKWRP